MDKNKKNLANEFLKKQKKLDKARKVLKSEFIGIDNIIDEIIDNVSSWFFLSDIQEKPIVINLWGLTGVGKTSLVNRLVELTGFADLFYKFDLGEKDGRFSFRETLNNLCENNDDTPIIIALDEIQHSRTVIGHYRQEIETDKNRMIWELIDSGRIQYVEWKSGLWSFEDMVYKLSYLIKAGVKTNNGKVIKKIKLYCKEMDINCNEKHSKDILFVPQDEYEKIIDFAGNYFGLYLQQDVKKLLMSYSADETITFLHKVLRIAKKPPIKNFTKALIFVLGNLDEAYTMSNNFSADIDADEFNKLSKKITVPQIKKALQNRFRNEQIARLGNIHIIYPALSKESYKKIIKNELSKYENDLYNNFKFKINFDSSVHDVIYSEGVYPTQGVRPIYTSIHQILKSKISLFISDIFLKSIKVDTLKFSIKNKFLNCDYISNNNRVFSKSVKVVTSLSDIRQNKKDDIQAITAVHESGHAVLSIILLKTIPDVIYSITSDVDVNGFVYSGLAIKYISRKDIIPRAAMILGGYVAEEIIFGKENLTTGAESDIEKATNFLSQMYKYSGMGKTPLQYNIPIVEHIDAYHKYNDVEDEIKNTICKAKKLAEDTINKYKKLLLQLADYLSDNRKLTKKDIKKLIGEDIILNFDLIENREHLFYRKHLKQLVKNVDSQKPTIPSFNNIISLNKN